MTLFAYTLICLAVWRITYMLVEEDGPYDIFKRLRADFPKGISPLECFYCTSIGWPVFSGFLYVKHSSNYLSFCYGDIY